MQGLALTQEQIVEILSVYATAERQVDAVLASPGWNVIGAFYMPATASVRVDVLGSVSHASLTLRVRLYDITAGSVGVVSGSEASLSSMTDVQVYSGNVELTAKHSYQFQCEVTGSSGLDRFGLVRRAAPVG